MKKNFLHGLMLVGLVAFTACGSEEEESDLVSNSSINHDAAIETEVSTAAIPGKTDSVLLTTRHKVWRNSIMVSEFVDTKTIPALGKMPADEQGVVVDKEYEFYITVK